MTYGEWFLGWVGIWERIGAQHWSDVMVAVGHNRNAHFGYRIVDAKMAVL